MQVSDVHVGGGGGTSGVMQEARSKSMNSSRCSCGLSAVPSGSHSAERLALGREASRSPLPVFTWKSLKRTRPHWFAAGAPTWVLKV